MQSIVCCICITLLLCKSLTHVFLSIFLLSFVSPNLFPFFIVPFYIILWFNYPIMLQKPIRSVSVTITLSFPRQKPVVHTATAEKDNGEREKASTSAIGGREFVSSVTPVHRPSFAPVANSARKKENDCCGGIVREGGRGSRGPRTCG